MHFSIVYGSSLTRHNITFGFLFSGGVRKPLLKWNIFIRVFKIRCRFARCSGNTNTILYMYFYYEKKKRKKSNNNNNNVSMTCLTQSTRVKVLTKNVVTIWRWTWRTTVTENRKKKPRDQVLLRARGNAAVVRTTTYRNVQTELRRCFSIKICSG